MKTKIKNGTKVFFNRVNALKKELKLLLVIAVTSIIIIDGFLIKIPEWFPGAYLIGSIYTKICYAFITSLVFFFINVHIGAEKAKVKTIRYINNKVVRLIDYERSLIYVLTKYSSVACAENEEKSNKIKVFCNNIDPHNQVKFANPLPMEFDDWFKLFHFIKLESREIIRDILFIRDTLNVDLLESLILIDDILEKLDATKGVPISNEDLEAWSYDIIEYSEACHNAMNILRTKYKTHINEHHHNQRQKNLKKDK